MGSPKVSVVLTSFNHEDYVGAAIQSVLDQTFEDFELLVVDDCSTDHSVEVIRSFRDPRIRLYENTTRRRATPGLNRCIAQSRADFVAIQHSDDLWQPTKLERQVQVLEAQPEVGAVFSHVEVIDEDDRPWSAEQSPLVQRFAQPNRDRLDWLGHFFRHGNALCHPSAVIRRRVFSDVGRYDFGFAQLGDLNQWVKVCLRWQIHVVPEPLVRFRLFRSGRNTSADRLDVHVRGGFEQLQLYRSYLGLKSSTEVARVFDEPPVEPEVTDPALVRFLVGRGFVRHGRSHSQLLFGLQTLHEVLQLDEARGALASRFDFDPLAQVALTGRHDVLGIFSERYLKMPSQVHAEVFLDRGQGYSAGDSERQDFKGRDGVYAFRWDPPVTLVELRLDPINVPAEVVLDVLEMELASGGPVWLAGHNGETLGEGRFLFGSSDPRIFFNSGKEKEPFQLRSIRVRLGFPALAQETVPVHRRWLKEVREREAERWGREREALQRRIDALEADVALLSGDESLLKRKMKLAMKRLSRLPPRLLRRLREQLTRGR